jgi:transposase
MQELIFSIRPAWEQFWRMAIETWQASGLPVRQFCNNEGLSEPSFYAWRKKLGISAATKDQDNSEPSAFIEVSLPKGDDIAIEVQLTSGNMVRIPFGTDSATLSNVMSVQRLCTNVDAASVSRSVKRRKRS